MLSMALWAIIVVLIVGFVVTFLLLKKGIKYLSRIGLDVKDMAKKHQPSVPISGGVLVMIGLFVSLLIYIFIRTFIYDDISSNAIILASICSMLIVAVIGFLDDLMVRETKKGLYVGLKRWQKPLLTLPAAIPLMVIKAGFSTLTIPFIGSVDFGLLYPLLLVPVGVIGAANMVNLLEGFNGLGTGMGIVYTLSLGLYAYVNGRTDAAVIAFAVLGALIAFYYYNKVPAKVLPGDSLTYLLGAAIVSIAVVGNIEKAALIISIPFILEFLLKARSKFKAQTYGKYEHGKIKSFYRKIYSIPHILTRTGKYTEKQIVWFMILIEVVFASLIWFI
ncbi:MAG: hypothetical protein U9R08_00045 [Nanoarchaeota archaeon]|nr:hypothetical protein [Nanoarchaeota archaeon]